MPRHLLIIEGRVERIERLDQAIIDEKQAVN